MTSNTRTNWVEGFYLATCCVFSKAQRKNKCTPLKWPLHTEAVDLCLQALCRDGAIAMGLNTAHQL